MSRNSLPPIEEKDTNIKLAIVLFWVAIAAGIVIAIGSQLGVI